MLGVVLARNMSLCANPCMKAVYVAWGWVVAMVASTSSWLHQSLTFIDTNSLTKASKPKGPGHKGMGGSVW